MVAVGRVWVWVLKFNSQHRLKIVILIFICSFFMVIVWLPLWLLAQIVKGKALR